MNYFSDLSWDVMKTRFPFKKFSIKNYHKILCPPFEYPDFLDKYKKLPILQRLDGISLFCGTDWTKLYNNRIKYSRLDHSVGVALIIWHFTKDKAQTIAGLLHDISTPVFSHVSDFRKGDALTQTITESQTSVFIRRNTELQHLLQQDNLKNEDIENYHKYPIADNEIPNLSADRLEYMFPSGVAFDGSWTLEEIKSCYENICILKNEQNLQELGFLNIETAEKYCEKFCSIGHILQLNENKLTLQMLGQIMNMAVKLKILCEDDFFKISEKQVIKIIERWIKTNQTKIKEDAFSKKFASFYTTFVNMTEILHTNEAQPENLFFNVNLKVKQRYINPLVKISENKICRLSEISNFAAKLIFDFKEYSDTKFGSVKLLF